MADTKQRSALRASVAWLLALAVLLGQRAAGGALAPPAVPLALRLQGVSHALDGHQPSLELPLGCPGAGSVLDVQHRVPAGAPHCFATLSVLFSGHGSPATIIWRSGKVPASQHPPTAAGEASVAGAAAALEPWFSFQLDPSSFQPAGTGSSSYALWIDVFCGDSSSSGSSSDAERPTLQSALFVATSCADGGSGSSGGGDSQEAASRAAVQLWQALAGVTQRVVGVLASIGSSSSSDGPPAAGKQQQQQPGAGQQAAPGIVLPGALLQDDTARVSSGGTADPLPQQQQWQLQHRRLAQASAGGLVPVFLTPASADGEIIVADGYSGLARAIANATSQLPAICGADGLPPPGSPGNATCLADPALRTAGAQVALLLTLGGGAAIPENVLPADAFTITGNASLIGVTRGPNGRTMTAKLRVAGTDPISVVVLEGALVRYGIANAQSNTVLIERDVTPPLPVITTPGAVAVTYDDRIFFSISFGEPVLGADPFELFGHNGARRIDAVLDVAAGRVDIVIYVLATDSALDFSVWVNKGTVQDLAGNANTQSAILTVKYRPKSAGLQGASVAANAVLGASLALCSAASLASSALLPYSPGVLGCGALSLLGYAQTLYFTGQLSAQWMPESYRQVAASFGWTVGEISLPWADSYPPDLDPAYGFSVAPTLLTSSGQQVDAAKYPALTASSVGNAPLVTVVGDLAPLPAGTTEGFEVLGGVPFLTPSEVQALGTPPRQPATPVVLLAPAPPAVQFGEGTAQPPGAQRRLAAAAAVEQQQQQQQQPVPRRGRRSLLQAVLDGTAPEQPAFEGTVYAVASRGLQYMSDTGQVNTQDVLVAGGAVQRAYDVMDAAGDDSAYPRQYYYDRLARTSFWASLLAFLVMAGHLVCLGLLMWCHAHVPNVLWFPRAELAVCLAILPALAYGASGLFNCSPGDIALGTALLLLLPCSFLGVAFYLLWRWLQHPALSHCRAIFVLRRDPLAEQIAAAAGSGLTPAGSPLPSPRDVPPLTDGEGPAGPPADATAAAASAAVGPSGSPEVRADDAAARARARRFSGLVRSLCGARRLAGDWCGINLDSRFVFKYGPLFELTYGQAMVRRRATYEFDPARGKVDRGVLAPLPELATISWRGKALLSPHQLRTPAQLLAASKVVVLAGGVSGVAALDSYLQCCLLVLLYGFHAIYLLAVRPYNSALAGAFQLSATLATLCVLGLAMVVMDGRGSSDLTRSTIGTVMLVVQLIAFSFQVAGAWWVSLRELWAALGMRRRLRLPPSPSDRFADAVQQVMARDPQILARKYLDRWMIRSLGVGLYDRPVWRRETEDLRRLLRATMLPKRKVAHLGSVVRRKEASPAEIPHLGPEASPVSAEGDHVGSAAGGSGGAEAGSPEQWTPRSAAGAPAADNPFASEAPQQDERQQQQH